MTDQDKQSASQNQRVEFLRETVSAVWGHCDRKFSHDISDAYSEFSLLKFKEKMGNAFCNVFLEEQLRINEALRSVGVDFVAIHYDTRRWASNERSPSSWMRAITPLSLESVDVDKIKQLFSERDLKNHGFRRSNMGKPWAFHFQAVNAAKPKAFSSNPNTRLSEVMYVEHDIYEAIKDPSLDQGLNLEILKQKFAKGDSSRLQKFDQFLARLNDFCEVNVNVPNSDAAIDLLLSSSLVTRHLLMKYPNYQLPRFFLMCPVYINERPIGGIAYFFKATDALGVAGKDVFANIFVRIKTDLQFLATSVISYAHIKEAGFIEADRRQLERNSPVVHFFVHSVQKALNVPILNVASEIKHGTQQLRNLALAAPKHPSMDGDPKQIADRVNTTADYLELTSRRWSGTLAALMNATRDTQSALTHRFTGVQTIHPASCTDELMRQLRAVFALQTGNEIYDDPELSEFESKFRGGNALDYALKLEIDFNRDDTVRCERDIFLLQLYELIQNSIESLPIGQAIKALKTTPRLLEKHSTGLAVKVKCSMSSEKDFVDVVVEDNGRGFNEIILAKLNYFFKKFADLENPATIFAVNKQLETINSHNIIGDAAENSHHTINGIANGTLSDKSGSALGQGLIGIADYQSRICRVAWPKVCPKGKRNSHPDEVDASQSVRILARGTISASNNEDPRKGAVIQLRFPHKSKKNVYENEDVGVFLEARE